MQVPDPPLDKEFSVFTFIAKITLIPKQRHNSAFSFLKIRANKKLAPLHTFVSLYNK